MKKLSRFLSVILMICIVVTAFAGCSKEKNRILYKDEKLEKYITLGDYKNLSVDSKGKDVKEYTEKLAETSDVASGIFETLTKGKVKKNDIANIDYVGKKDGVAFEGGTAQGSDLKIGSNTFIPGFEDGLIGTVIGETIDLDLTFPKEYHSEDLAGQKVVFTVKVNHVKRIDQTLLKEKAIKNHLIDLATKNSKIKEYPQKEMDILYAAKRNILDINVSSQTGMDLTAYFAQVGTTEEAFKEDLITSEIKPNMDIQMTLYAIADKENLKYSPKQAQEAAEKTAKNIGENVTVENVKSFYGEYYFEEMVFIEMVSDFLYEQAKIK